MKIYMLTIPQTRTTRYEACYWWPVAWPEEVTYTTKRMVKCMIANNDVKRWVIAKETGLGGYKHWQIRLETSNPEFFAYVKKNLPYAHVEEASDVWKYERKEGHFWTSDDTTDIRKIRFGTPNEKQREILRIADRQNDREIDVWYDPVGNHGKTWLSIHLYELGQAMVIPRSSTTAEKLSAYACSCYDGEKYIIADIPRSRKITPELYEAFEELKDGLVFDHRYSGHCRNIRGAKLIVFTNVKLDTAQLSKDRWRLHGFGRTSS